MSLLLLVSIVASFIPAGIYSAYRISPAGRVYTKLNKQKKRSKRLTKIYEKKVENARQTFKRNSERYVENYRMEIADALAITSLKSFGAKKVRWTALKDNGYKTVGDLIRKPEVTYISGVGPGSADSLDAALKNALLAIDGMDLPEPKVGDSYEGEALLFAAQNLIETIDASARVTTQLADIDAVSDEIGTVNFGDWLTARDTTSDTAKEDIEKVETLELSLEKIEDNSNQKKASRMRPELREQILELIAEMIPGGSAAMALYGALTSEERNSVQGFPLITDGLKVELRRYQSFGAKFSLQKKRVLLGDEMGLGKTIQALAVMTHLTAKGAKHFVVLAPAGVVFNWIHEIETRSGLTGFAFTGTERESLFQRWQEDGGVLVTSYSTARSSQLGKKIKHLDVFVADEAHYAKNPSSGRTKTTRSLAENAEYVIFMSGTPIENKATEFVDIVEPLDSDLAIELRGQTKDLGKQVAIQSAKSLVIGRPSAQLILILMKELQSTSFEHVVSPREFRHLVRNTYLRRNQIDVLAELPECIETESWTSMTAKDLNRYRTQVENRNFMGMRRVCGTEGKLNLLETLMEEFRDSERKVVIFSNFLDNLDLIEARIPNVVARIDGSVSPQQRMSVIETFRSAPGHAIMVAQIVAAGIGINLQFASAVVIFEPQIKPSIEDQAIARVKRMGQKKRVIVHHLLCADSVDERMLILLDRKRRDFDNYARESIAKQSAQKLDAGEVNRILSGEAKRLGITVAEILIDAL